MDSAMKHELIRMINDGGIAEAWLFVAHPVGLETVEPAPPILK
jgi:mannose-6-phosphate isomerase class I